MAYADVLSIGVDLNLQTSELVSTVKKAIQRRPSTTRFQNNAHRLTTLGACPNGCTQADGSARAIWSKGLCHACYNKAWRREMALSQTFHGNLDNRDSFIKIVEGFIKAVRPHRGVYARYLAGRLHDDEHFTDWEVIAAENLLEVAENTLTAQQYNYVIRQINDGAPEGERLPLKRQEGRLMTNGRDAGPRRVYDTPCPRCGGACQTTCTEANPKQARKRHADEEARKIWVTPFAADQHESIDGAGDERPAHDREPSTAPAV